DGLQRAAESLEVEIRRHGEERRLVPVVWIGELLIEEGALDGEQRHVARRPHFARGVDDALRVRGDAGDGLPLQHGARRDLPTGAADAGDDLQAEDRVATELE